MCKAVKINVILLIYFLMVWNLLEFFPNILCISKNVDENEIEKK